MLKIGDRAPAFSLFSDEGTRRSLKDLKGKTVILYFYPKDMTSGCTQEACDFRDSFSRLQKMGVEVIGISKDSVSSHQKFKSKYELPFLLLADEDTSVCQSYGVWVQKSMYGRKYMGIERSTFVIDPAGKIQGIFSKVKVKGHIQELIEFIRK